MLLQRFWGNSDVTTFERTDPLKKLESGFLWKPDSNKRTVSWSPSLSLAHHTHQHHILHISFKAIQPSNPILNQYHHLQHHQQDHFTSNSPKPATSCPQWLAVCGPSCLQRTPIPTLTSGAQLLPIFINAEFLSHLLQQLCNINP